MIEEIYKKIWALSPQVQNPDAYEELVRLTAELIKLYDSQGRLSQDPFIPTRQRTVSLPAENIHEELKDRTCLVTGGLGCVGTLLVAELLKFDLKRIIILDIQDDCGIYSTSEKVVSVRCDIRDPEKVKAIFTEYHPNFVFHTAAQRHPGLAELNIVETVTTNVLGTLNIIRACEAVGTVKQLVSASTGKASRYFTEEVYAATKKLTEFILDTYAQKSYIKYTLVRFTHILDNSLMNAELKNSSMQDRYLSIHSPGKYVTAQNASEAAYLMLNALVCSVQQQCSFLLVRYLEWPVESLEMALYYIKESGRKIPVIFVGNPLGYTEKFFRGQMDWTRPEELNLLTNVYERRFRRLNQSEDIIISRPCSTNKLVLETVLDRIRKAKGEKETKEVLVEGLKEIVRASLKTVDPKETVDILHWSLEPRFLKLENAQVSDFRAIVPLLVESLEESEYMKEVEDLLYQQS